MQFITGHGLAQARNELATKTCEQIEVETAARWACRAIAAWEKYRQTGDLYWYSLAVDFHHEAIEHAAGAEGKYVDAIRADIREATNDGIR